LAEEIKARNKAKLKRQRAVDALLKSHGQTLKNVGRDADGKNIPHVRDEVTADTVARYVACGATDEEISVMLNIRPGLLRKCYEKELDIGKVQNDMKVAGALLDMASSGEDTNATIYWTKARMGWRDKDTPGTQITNPLQINIHI
jgi:hypothetical protein